MDSKVVLVRLDHHKDIIAIYGPFANANAALEFSSQRDEGGEVYTQIVRPLRDWKNR